MPLPELEKGLLREQLDKHTTFAGSIAMADKIELQEMELEQIAFNAALQHRANFYIKRHGRVAEAYRTKYGLGDIIGNKDNGTEPITLQEMIAVYMGKYPDTILNGKELEDVAMSEYSIEQNSIDAEINADIVGNGSNIFTTEEDNIIAFSNTKRGIRDKLDNLKRAVVTASWKV